MRRNMGAGYVVKEETPTLAQVSAKHKIILTQITQAQRVPIAFSCVSHLPHHLGPT